MFYRWKEAFDTFGMESLRSRTSSIAPGIRKLKKENERLRKIVADKELDVEMLQEALKNTKKFCKSINQ